MLRTRSFTTRPKPPNHQMRRLMLYVPIPFQTCTCAKSISTTAVVRSFGQSIPSPSVAKTTLPDRACFSTSASPTRNTNSMPTIPQNSLKYMVLMILESNPQTLLQPFPHLPQELLQWHLRVVELEALELEFRETPNSTSRQRLLHWQRAVLLRCYAQLEPQSVEDEARILLATLRLVCEAYSDNTSATGSNDSTLPQMHNQLFTLQFLQVLLFRCVTLAASILQQQSSQPLSSSKTSSMQTAHYQEICGTLNERIYRLHHCLFHSSTSGLPSFVHNQPRNELNPYYLNLMHWFVLNRDYKSIEQMIQSRSVAIPPLTTASGFSSDHSSSRPFAPSDENFLLHRLHQPISESSHAATSHTLSTRHMLIVLNMAANTGDSEFAEFLLHQIEHAELHRLAALKPSESTALSLPPGVATSALFDESILANTLMHAYSLALQACSSSVGGGGDTSSITRWERMNRIWLRLRQLIPSIAGVKESSHHRGGKARKLQQQTLSSEDPAFLLPPSSCLQLPANSKLPILLLNHFTAAAETSSARSINWNAIFELTTALGERLPFEFCNQLTQVAVRQLINPQFRTRESSSLQSSALHTAVSTDFAESRLKQLREVVERLWNYSCLHAPSPLPTPASCGDVNWLVLLIEYDCALRDWNSVELHLSYLLGDSFAMDSATPLELMGLPSEPSSMLHPALQKCLEKLAREHSRKLDEHALVSDFMDSNAVEALETADSTPPLLDSLLPSLLNSIASFTIRSGQVYLMESFIDAYPRWLFLLLPRARIFQFALLQRIYLAAFETQQQLVSSARPPTNQQQLRQQQYDILVYALEFLRTAPSKEFDPVIFKEMAIGCLDSLRQLLLQLDETASVDARSSSSGSSRATQQLNSVQSMLAEVDELLRREYEDLQQHYIQLVWPKVSNGKSSSDEGVMFIHILLTPSFKLEQLPAFALLLLRLIRKHGKLLLAQHSASTNQSVQEKQRKIVVRFINAAEMSGDVETKPSSAATQVSDDKVASLKDTLANFLPAASTTSTSLTTPPPFSIRTLFSHKSHSSRSSESSSMTAVTDRVHHYLMEEARLAWSSDIETARESSLGPAQLQLRASRLLQRLLQHEISSHIYISGHGEGEGEVEGLQRGGKGAVDSMQELLESIKPWAKESEDMSTIPPSIALSMSNVERQQWLQWNRERHAAADDTSSASSSSSSSAAFWFSLAQVRSLCAYDHPVWRELGFSVREGRRSDTSGMTATAFRDSFSRAFSQHFASERRIAWSDRQRRMGGVGNSEELRQSQTVRGIIGKIRTAYQEH